MNFLTQFSDFNPLVENVFDNSITEQVGYRSTEQIVKSYINAGEALHAFRHSELYDYPDRTKDVDDYPDLSDIDPTRSLDFDEIDAIQTMRSLDLKLKSDKTKNSSVSDLNSKETVIVSDKDILSNPGTTDAGSASSERQ